MKMENEQIRKELHCESKLVIGNVGRLCYQKNLKMENVILPFLENPLEEPAVPGYPVQAPRKLVKAHPCFPQLVLSDFFFKFSNLAIFCGV